MRAWDGMVVVTDIWTMCGDCRALLTKRGKWQSGTCLSCGGALPGGLSWVLCAKCADSAGKPRPHRCDWCGDDCHNYSTLDNGAVSMTICAKCAEGQERKHIDTHMERARLAARVNELQREVNRLTGGRQRRLATT